MHDLNGPEIVDDASRWLVRLLEFIVRVAEAASEDTDGRLVTHCPGLGQQDFPSRRRPGRVAIIEQLGDLFVLRDHRILRHGVIGVIGVGVIGEPVAVTPCFSTSHALQLAARGALMPQQCPATELATDVALVLFIQLPAIANNTHAAKLVIATGHANEVPSAPVALVADVVYVSEAYQARLAFRVWSVEAAPKVPCTTDFDPSDNVAIIARVVAWGAETSSIEVIRVGSSSILHRSSGRFELANS